MKGIFALAALGWFALASGVTVTNPKALVADTIFLCLTSRPGDLKLEREYDFPTFPRIAVNTGPVRRDISLSNLRLSFLAQPTQHLTLSLNDPENLRIKGQLTFPSAVVTAQYTADISISFGDLKAHYTGSGNLKFTAQTTVIDILGELKLTSPERLALAKLEVATISFPPGGTDLKATGAQLNGNPMSEADVQQTAQDLLPLLIFLTLEQFQNNIATAIGTALARQSLDEWELELSVDSGEKPGYY